MARIVRIETVQDELAEVASAREFSVFEPGGRDSLGESVGESGERDFFAVRTEGGHGDDGRSDEH